MNCEHKVAIPKQNVAIPERICSFEDCSESAFICWECQQCLNNHDHYGSAPLSNWKHLITQLENSGLKSRRSNTHIDEILCLGNNLINEIQIIINKYQGKRIPMGLSNRQDINNIIQRITNKDISVTGSQIHQLKNHLNKTQPNPQRHQQQIIHQQIDNHLNNIYRRQFQSMLNTLQYINTKNNMPQTSATATTIITSNDKQFQNQIQNPIAHQTKSNTISMQSIQSTPTIQEKPTDSQDWHITQQKKRKPKQQPQQQLDITQNQIIKIERIPPQQDKQINIIAKVIQCKTVTYKTGETFIECVLGDETGTVNGRFRVKEDIQEGEVISLQGVRVSFHQSQIVLKSNPRRNSIRQQPDILMNSINKKNNVSRRATQRRR